METDYSALKIERKSGNERFIRNGKEVGPNLLDFWKWSYSDLTSNTARGVLAEYLVASALGITEGFRDEWNSFDLKFEGTKIEVKSSSYLQNWKQKRLSTISFGIQRTKIWDSETNKMVGELRRHADIYVFCVLANVGLKPLNPLDLDQWEFYVLPTRILNENCETQKSIGLERLKTLGATYTKYENLLNSISRFGS